MEGTYFCKLLPVKGEIKSGDLFQFPGMPTQKCTGTDDGLIWYEPNNSQIDSASCDPGDCQRMALHLLGEVSTTNVENGEKVYDLYGQSDISGGKWRRVTWEDISNPCNLKGFYRVIGLVSPAATWVREGGAYSEDEIRRIAIVHRKDGLSIHPDRFRTPMNAWLKSSFNTGEHYVTEEIEIKCPCCGSFK